MSPKLVLLRGSEAMAVFNGGDGSTSFMFHLPGAFTFDKPTGVRLVTVTGASGQLIVYGNFMEPQPTSGAINDTVLGVFPSVANPAVPLSQDYLPARVTLRLQPTGLHDHAVQPATLGILLAIE